MKGMTQETINQFVNSSLPERLSLGAWPPITNDHVAHILQLTRMGQTCLAADHLLFPEMNGVLSKIVSGVIRKLNILFITSKPFDNAKKELFRENLHFRQYTYETLLEMSLNFYGLESRWLDEGETGECLQYTLNVLDEWENLERKEGELSIAEAVIRKWLSRM